ncbi:MAG: DUF4398 domain-containing protein [Polyangiaceae bacterium]|nr:DUF4398 domain-containing protein [Polyangiaceae bacterium]
MSLFNRLLRETKTLLTMGVVCIPLACGGSQVPTRSVADARASAAAAQAVGAERDPQAALHLKLANDNLARAERLIAEEEMEEAKLVLDEAKIDADLAFKLAKVSESKRQVGEAQTRLQELSQQAGGVTP